MLHLCCLLASIQIVSISAKSKQDSMYDDSMLDFAELQNQNYIEITTSRSYHVPLHQRKHLKVNYFPNDMMQIHPTVRLTPKHEKKANRKVALENISDQRENSSKRQKTKWKQLLRNYLDTGFANYVPDEKRTSESDMPESNISKENSATQDEDNETQKINDSNENAVTQEEINETQKISRKYKKSGKKAGRIFYRLNNFWVSRYTTKANEKRRVTAEIVYNAILTYFRRVVDSISTKNDNL
ncbi:hypothetical protein ILUMI_13788 [Ignelater luminosus]|uniref:Uncharacterized protein n=1 Tax=Ignelater luminosus TaxID=2038154 RepID=A0A8K0CRQ5_IGNLU|nr:hypothetical protein ILUMI_13788 [Ignelater luminosus]